MWLFEHIHPERYNLALVSSKNPDQSAHSAQYGQDLCFSYLGSTYLLLI